MNFGCSGGNYPSLGGNSFYFDWGNFADHAATSTIDERANGWFRD